MESLHKVFLKMIKEAKERMFIPHEPKKPEEIIDAEEILQENEVAKEWQVTALNELLELPHCFMPAGKTKREPEGEKGRKRKKMKKKKLHERIKK